MPAATKTGTAENDTFNLALIGIVHYNRTSFGGTANAQTAILILLFGDKVATENFYLSMRGGAVSAVSRTTMTLNSASAAISVSSRLSSSAARE